MSENETFAAFEGSGVDGDAEQARDVKYANEDGLQSAAAQVAPEQPPEQPTEQPPEQPSAEEKHAYMLESAGRAAEARMADILASGKAPAVIKQRGSKPRRLVSRAGRIYDKDRD